MVKSNTAMKVVFTSTVDPQVKPAPPNLIKSLTVGFDAISNHVGLILFPVLLDLLLWLGPHIRLQTIIEGFLLQVESLQSADAAETASLMASNREVWQLIADRFNLLSALRTYPIGVFSLMAGRSPVEGPFGAPLSWDVPSFGMMLLIWITITLIGLVVAALFYSAVAQAAVSDGVDWFDVLRRWPRTASQVLLLAGLFLTLLLALSVPMSCFLTLMAMGGASFLPFAFLVAGVLLVWVLMPFLFSAHGIFVHGMKMWTSVRQSARLVRMTLPATGLLFLIVILISEGLDILWNVPAETSWLMLVSVTGHAFITTSLLAATFVYYRDASLWVEDKFFRPTWPKRSEQV